MAQVVVVHQSLGTADTGPSGTLQMVRQETVLALGVAVWRIPQDLSVGVAGPELPVTP